MSSKNTPQILTLTSGGLFTNPNMFSQVPLGSLAVASNLTIDRDGLLQSRRGFKQFGEAFPTEGLIFTLYQIFPFKGTQVVWYKGQFTQIDHLLAFDSKAFAVGTVTVVDYTGLSGDSLTIGGVVLTEGTDWDAETSNEITAQNLLTAILVNITTVTVLANGNILALTASSIGSAGNSIALVSSNGADLSVSAATLLGGIDPGTWDEIDGDLPPAQQETDTYHTAEASGNLYFSTTMGVRKLDEASGPILKAGGLPGLDAEISTTGSSGWFDVNSQVAYRMTWQHEDTNDNIIVGTPSQRDLITNGTIFSIVTVVDGTNFAVDSTTGMTAGDTVIQGINSTTIVTVTDPTHIEVDDTIGFAEGEAIYGHTVNTSLTYTIPAEATTDHTYKIFRSEMSPNIDTQPSDTLLLVLEGSIDSTDISNGYFTVTDSVPQTLRRETIYTAPGQQGILQQNNIPPACSDIVIYKNYLLFSGTTLQHLFALTLLSVGPSDGVQIDDTLTITRGTETFTITGKASENIAAGQFLVETSFTPGENIYLTALSIVRVMNRYFSNTILYAFYVSAVNDAPGKISLQERNIGDDPFELTSSRSTCWSPELPSSDGPTSTADSKQNLIYYSKSQQPEAVPLLNFQPVGSANAKTERILALRDSVVVFREDGVYRLTGETAPFVLTTLDTTIILRAPETAVRLTNQVFAFTNQGVVEVSETSSQIISRPIENLLQTLSSVQFDNFNRYSFGTAYEDDRKYILWTIDKTDPTKTATIGYVYNLITEKWTVYVPPVAIWDSIIDPADGKMYLASGDQTSPYVYQERKQFLFWDYADQEFEVTLVGSTGTTVELDDTTDLIVGDKLVQLDDTVTPFELTRKSTITEITDSTHVEVEDDLPWDPDETTIAYRPIPIDIVYLPVACGNPGMVKTFKEFQGIFQEIDAETVDVSFTTDFSLTGVVDSLVPFNIGGWGDFPWGDIPWGDSVQLGQNLQTYIPLSVRRGHYLYIRIQHEDALSNFILSGFHLTYQDNSTRFFTGGN